MMSARFVIKIAVLTCAALIGLAATFTLFIAGLFYAAMPWHDLTLWRLEQTLSYTISHPPNSHTIEKKKFFGSRYTDISECTYAVGEFRSSSLSRDELLHTYNRKFDLLSFVRNKPHIIIVENDTSLPLDNPADAWIVDFRKNLDKKDNTTYYIVYFYEEGTPWWGDIRCYS